MTGHRPHLAGHEVPDDDALGAAVDHDQVEHLVAGVRRHVAARHLSQQRLGCRHLQLLAGLAAGVIGAADLHTAERAGAQRPSVLAGERRPDGVEVVDHPARLLGQAVHVGLAPAEVATLHGVEHHPLDAVVVHLAGAGGVDAALGGDRVGASRRIVEGEALDLIAEFAERSRGPGTGQAGADHDHLELGTVGGADQPVAEPAIGPQPGGIVAGRRPAVEVIAEVA